MVAILANQQRLQIDMNENPANRILREISYQIPAELFVILVIFIKFHLMEILTQIDISRKGRCLPFYSFVRSFVRSLACSTLKKRIKLKCYELCVLLETLNAFYVCAMRW